MAGTDPVLKRLGVQIRRLRENVGLSQEKLAEKASLHRTYVSGVERGLRNPSVKSLSKIASALRADIGELFRSERESR